MKVFYPALRPLLFRIDPERAVRLAISGLKLAPLSPRGANDPILASTVAGIGFPNPIGLAAGFDKNAEVPMQAAGLGFGFVEVGSLTPRPQVGNPLPRVFRLKDDEAIINRMGFPNEGIEKGVKRLRRMRFSHGSARTGVNVGANKDSEDRIADYEACITLAAPVADYLTVNISSPNTPGLRELQSKDALHELLSRCLIAREHREVPLFVKVAPDLTDRDIADIAEVVQETGVDGIICTNTTVSRAPDLRSSASSETGGLSGPPLREMALAVLKAFRQATGGRIPLVGVGGIASADDAYERIRAGASLVQLYTALVYEGPSLPKDMAEGLADHLRADGFSSVADAVGADAPKVAAP
ncbi:dihydroorotate dehydrogenase (quinone) [Pacificimonas flava]|uniref:Dihydroorotate dehydrogenase (quinone) n=2 Tax=Pacificimonas TaxID=1960290 RepID=A0A219B476_9SPHN|nr:MULTISPECIES: quinone-dependent dihydroorotate dehydrogenase [Pacificimonas]MBZ6377734.1 quinone-dependent dihydroorotate dehydrogenase [Pacificimonas aurantium]OWV32588.1 dihydroorotate dehydrogenase (quinone) [Pacificimonas flava]